MTTAMSAHLVDAKERLQQSSDKRSFESVAIDLKVFNEVSNALVSLNIKEIKKSISSLNVNQGEVVPTVVSVKAVVNEFDELSLLGVDEIEEQLAIDGGVGRSELKFKDVLYALNERLTVLFETKSLKMSTNPIAPSVLLKQYAEILKKELFSEETCLLLYKSYEETVLLKMGDVYQKINDLCIENRVLPKLPKRQLIYKNNTGESSVERRSEGQSRQGNEADRGGDSPGNTHEISDVLYRSLVDMVQLHSAKVGRAALSDGLMVSGDSISTVDLIETLTAIQKKNVIEGVAVDQNVRLQIGSQFQSNGVRQPYEEQDDTLINIIAMFFDVVLQDKQLPNAVRLMIAQLQIPILKVAMIDKEFFAKKAHPARKFLNSLSQAGLGVSEQNRQVKSAVFEKMEELVDRVLMDFDDDVEIFTELLDEFDIFMEQQQCQIDVIEERSRKVTRSSEQIELTRRQATYEIALRLNGKSIPEFVQLFLDDAWKDVLVLALLRREKEPAETQKCIDVIEALVESVMPKNDDAARKNVIKGLTRLLKDIKVGLENISYDFHQSAPFFKELESFHKRLFATVENQSDDIPIAEEVVLVAFDEDLCASLEEDLLQELEGHISEMPDDKFSKKANAMAVGDWVAYTNTDGEALRAKLSWKSSVTMQCLFVDDRGAKAMDISVAECAEELRQKKMTLVGQEKAPLVERALAGIQALITSDDLEPNAV
ncbi:MAG: DUF1631 domain-containing protein [Cycloclasticus sp.]|nr:DUF1631 domain-containing protein [Cycloclasticus sp.]